LIPHGEYGAWLKASFGWSSKTAYRYRKVFNLSEICQNDNSVNIEVDLNLSISALYLLAELNLAEPQAEAIIAAAKKCRVTYSIAKQIIADVDAREAEKDAVREATLLPPPAAVEPTTRTVEVEISHRSIPLDAPITRLPGHTIPLSPAKPTEPDQATLDRVKSVMDGAKKRKPAPAAVKDSAPAPAPAAPPVASSAPNITLLLQWLPGALCDPRTDTASAIAAAGARNVRETIHLLQDAIAQFDGENSVQRMADAAELKSKSKDVKAATPAAAYPDLPAGLDRRSKPQTAEVDEEAAEIAAQAAQEKKWLES
jgi:hypothetical protein